MKRIKCTEPFGLLEKGKTYDVIAEGTGSYTMQLPGGRNGYFSKKRFEVVEETTCNHDCEPMCAFCNEQADIAADAIANGEYVREY